MPYDYAVYIGRFQPPHLGHAALLRHAASLAREVVVVLGSAETARSIRNPFSFEERRTMLTAMAEADGYRLRCIGVRDSAYNLEEWLTAIKAGLYQLIGTDSAGAVDDGLAPVGPSLVLVGAFKDSSSFYLEHFPEWPLDCLPVQARYNATALRTAMFEAGSLDPDLLPTDLAGWLHPALRPILKSWMDTDWAAWLLEEYRQVSAYRNLWAAAPYPPVFVTVDAVVLCAGHLLVVERGGWPGKGLYAFPGGFLEPAEGMEAACLRELAEETGLRAPAQSLRQTAWFDAPDRDPRGRIISQAFLFDLGSLPALPAVRGGDDAARAFWLPLDRIQELERRFFADHARIARYFLNRLG